MQVLRWSDYCLPLAYSPGPLFRVVAQTSLENFSLLGVAFIEDRLHLDNGLVPSKIVRRLLSLAAPHCQHTELTVHLQFRLHYFTENQNYFSNILSDYKSHITFFDLTVLPHFCCLYNISLQCYELFPRFCLDLYFYSSFLFLCCW